MAPENKTYRVVTQVYVTENNKDGVPVESMVTSFGGSAEGATFADALPFIQSLVNDHYEQVVKFAAAIDQPAT